jgi:signal transduction histidine kinase/CheY-like chemotaxis protein
MGKNEKNIDTSSLDRLQDLLSEVNIPLDKSQAELAEKYNEIAEIYKKIKDSDNALVYYNKALEIWQNLNNVEKQLIQYKSIGYCYLHLFQFSKAIDIFKIALSLAYQVNNKVMIVEIEMSLGNAHNWSENFDLSEIHLSKALKNIEYLNGNTSKISLYLSFAILLRKQRKFSDSKKYFEKCVEFLGGESSDSIVNVYKSYGYLFMDIGDLDNAEFYFKKGEVLIDKCVNSTVVLPLYEHLMVLYEKKKDFEKAYVYSQKFHEQRLALMEQGFSEESNLLHAKIGLADAKRERIIAEESANAKSLFIATISHEIRTPMNIILGTTSLMLNDKPKKEHEKYLQTLKRSGENLLGIINDILDISKIEAGRLEIELEPTDIREVFENIFTTMEQPAKDKRLELTYSVDDKINFFFHSDPLRLNQIITNLISNSTKFTAKGSIHFEAKLKSKNKLEIIVRDTGIGIPKDKLPTIFDQYEQVRTKVQKKYKGTGLGLAISKKLVEMLNGTIQIKSKINEGTTFIIQLPIEKSAMQKNVDENVIKKDTSFLKDKTILIVDDLEDNRFILKQTLLFYHKDLNILEAENGLVAVDHCRKNKIDLVIMDLDMPEMNGFEALSEIRKNKKTKDLIVVASTASLITNGDDEFIEFGFNTYLPKPFEMDDLYNLLVKTIKPG